METKACTLEELNTLAAQNPKALIAAGETDYNTALEETAAHILAAAGRKIVMLAGPSASGKTTTAYKLAKKIEAHGVACAVLSLDDFYLNRRDVPKGADGKPDFEAVGALDLPLLRRCLSELLAGRKTELPIFDFTVGRRAEQTRTLKPAAQDAVIVEGLHALNPVITDALPQEALQKVYISVSSRICDKDGAVVFSKRNLRFMRRLVRDYLFRASSVENTIALWKNVRRGEDAYLFPYEHLADYRINSLHLAEPCLFAPLVRSLFHTAGLEHSSADTERLLHALAQLTPLSPELVPEDSLLREFLGTNAACKFTK